MNKVKNLKEFIFAILCIFIITSCSTLQTGVQQVELGMSKSDVVKKLGNDYQVVSLIQIPEGNLEVLRFPDQVAENGSFVIKGYYVLHFLNNKLVELNHEDVRRRPEHSSNSNSH